MTTLKLQTTYTVDIDAGASLLGDCCCSDDYWENQAEAQCYSHHILAEY